LDINVSENDLFNSLKNHINPTLVIDKLRILKEKFGNDVQKRMSQ